MEYHNFPSERNHVVKKSSFLKILKQRATAKCKKVLALGPSVNPETGRNNNNVRDMPNSTLQGEPCSDLYSSLKEEQLIREKIRDSLACPICTDIMLDPVSLDCGHTFCLHCLAHDYGRRTDGVLICCICRDGSSKAVAVSRSLLDVVESAFSEEIRHRRECMSLADRQAIDRLMTQQKRTPKQIQMDQYWVYLKYAAPLAVFVVFLTNLLW